MYFTKKERRLLEIKINSGIKTETDGKILFTTFLRVKLTKGQIEKLKTIGFESNDILNLNYYGYKSNPTYFKKRNKKLEEPLKINAPNGMTNIGSYKMMYTIFKERIDKSDKLIEYEKLQMMAIQKALSIDESDSKYIFDQIVEERQTDFKFILEQTLI